jgi:uncharacterized lipoprotein YddW (UPF0748 family)
MKKFLLALFSVIYIHTFAQNNIAQPLPPKYEFRGAWIATIGNIDWPSSGAADSYTQQTEFVNLLNQLQRNGINAVIVQIRPAADAFYPSEKEPWSKYISGTQGLPPQPYYDPLAFMITEAHKRGMEFHAWFNPFRALVDSRKNLNPQNHVTRTNPQWFINYGGKKYFDPGIPDVRTYVTDIVCDVVKKYDIDAVHFDDYFYPYKIGNSVFNDSKSYKQYGYNFIDKGDWRRDNVNTFVQTTGQAIKKIKPFVKFGISPFGVWRNYATDSLGSFTTATQNYDDLYADVRLWLQRGWIDYVMPQLYWERAHTNAPFTTLINWWNNNSFGKACYAGLGLYHVGINKKPEWQTPYEIPEQINLIRNNKNIGGACFYSANFFYKNNLGVIDIIRNEKFNNRAIVPPMKWIDSIAPEKPKVQYVTNTDKTIRLYLTHASADATQFCIYKIPRGKNIDVKSSKYLLFITTATAFETQDKSYDYVYAITSLDRLHNESAPMVVQKK